MSDAFALSAAIFSALATGLAALATWRAPQSAAELAESLRRDAERAAERRRLRFEIFATLMQERAAIYTEDAVRALNSIDLAFSDSNTVRDAWAELFLIFNESPLPSHALEERLRKLLVAMANDLGLGESIKIGDIGRVYSPNAIVQDRLIRDMQRQQMLNSLQGSQPPAANTAPTQDSRWPPRPS
jgi:hypothetical protein